MFRTIMTGMLSAAALLSTGAYAAEKFGTAPEAKALLERALPGVKADKTAAFAKFNKGEDGFRDRDLHVFCANLADGKINAGAPSTIGVDARALKDKTGFAFGAQMLKDAAEGRITEVSYMFARPESTEPAQKVSYVTRVADQVCGAGYYKQLQRAGVDESADRDQRGQPAAISELPLLIGTTDRSRSAIPAIHQPASSWR